MNYKMMIQDFSLAMQYKIDADHNKWSTVSIDGGLKRLNDKVADLCHAVNFNVKPQFVLTSAAEIANYAMLIADKYSDQYKVD